MHRRGRCGLRRAPGLRSSTSSCPSGGEVTATWYGIYLDTLKETGEGTGHGLGGARLLWRFWFEGPAGRHPMIPYVSALTRAEADASTNGTTSPPRGPSAGGLVVEGVSK